MNVACVGDCDVDRFVDLGIDRPGGITLNFAVHARRLFPSTDRVIVVTAVGTDPEAEVVTAAIEQAGLECCLTRLPGQTPVQHIERLPSGERRFVGYVEGVLAQYRMGQREQQILLESDLVMAPVYSQILDLFESVMRSSSRGLRAVDFSDLADFGHDIEIVRRYLDHVDIGFFGIDQHRERLVSELERQAHAAGKLFVVTLGAEGSVALGTGAPLRCPAEPVGQIVDTTGAGDSFAAGFLQVYCSTRDVEASLRAGSRQAALTIAMLGGF